MIPLIELDSISGHKVVSLPKSVAERLEKQGLERRSFHWREQTTEFVELHIQNREVLGRNGFTFRKPMR